MGYLANRHRTQQRGISRILAISGALALGLLAACTSRTGAIRYKLIVNVDTPAGLKSGSSIVESDFGRDGLTLGQAPFVDLGNGRYLFALLSDPFSKKTLYGIVLRALRYPEARPPLENPQGNAFIQAKRSKQQVEIRHKDYPMLVTFGNVKDPTTVAEVDPNNLVANFGEGYRLETMSIEVVDQDDPLTEGLEDILTWIDSHPEKKLKAANPRKLETVAEAPLSRRLSNLSFVYRLGK